MAKWTRRRFLEAVGRVGGAAAVYESMVALGMVRVPEPAYAQPLEIPPGAGSGKTIAILGAGIAGLTAAYELRKRNSGYNIMIFEAQNRTGGRSYTVRAGDTIIEKHGSQTWEQTCKFQGDKKNQYLNAGPGRIPYHHTVALNYCKELGVRIEPYVMTTRANLYQNNKGFGGKPMPHRRVLNDTRGWISELLAKAVDQGSLNVDIPDPMQRELLLDLLNTFGPLKNKKYVGSQRSGYVTQPGVITPGVIEPSLPFADILGSKFWLDRMYQPEDYEWQPTLFQPVEGMDKLADGFVSHIDDDRILKGAVVTSVRNVNNKVEIRYRYPHPDSEERTYPADWCISTIPVWILKDIDNNFSPTFMDALKAPKRGLTCKVGWQANRRFWELDDEIYGGISYINNNITQMWYPSNGYLFEDKGVLTGAYNYGDSAEYLGDQSLDDRLKIAAAGAFLLHGKAFNEAVPDQTKTGTGLSIAWHHVPYQLAGWANWDKVETKYYDRLLEPEGHVIVAGDQVSYLPGWQEGAMLSAHHVLRRIINGTSLKATAAATTKRSAPDTHALTQGSGRTRN